MKKIAPIIVTGVATLLSSTAVFSQTPTSPHSGAKAIVSDDAHEHVRKHCPNMSAVHVANQQVANQIVCAPQSDDLENIIADMQKFDLLSNPIQAGNDGDREALRHLPDVSFVALEKTTARTRGLFERYLKFDTDGLSEQQILNHQLFGFVLRQKLLLADFDTARLPFTNDSGFFNMMSYVSRQTKFNNVDDYEAYAARLSELPRYFAQNITNLRRGIASEYTASEQIMPGIINVVKGLSNGEAEAHSFFAPLPNSQTAYPLRSKSG